MRLLVQTALAMFLLAGFAFAEDVKEWPGEVSDFHGFERRDFDLDGRSCIVVRPFEEAPGKPWVWRARFFGGYPNADLALLSNGFHLVYTDVAELYGNREAVTAWDAFYTFLTAELGLADRAVLEGLSRGALPVFSWASANPEKVACIYVDAPVCDLYSWPGRHRPDTWREVLQAYGRNGLSMMFYKGYPVHQLEPLAAAGIPLLHVVGDLDDTVPVAENTAVVERRYRALGGDITVIHKPDCDHHPHGLEDPAPIVEFILRHTAP